jgi:lipoate---protein ligase
MPAAPAWVVQHRRGTASEIHQPWPEGSSRDSRILAVCDITGPATIVLGSSQPEPELDLAETERTGVVVTRRSTGGGAVYVAPAAQVWVDVWVPRGDPLWVDDVIDSSAWLGRAWLDALALAGAVALTIHGGRLEKGLWGEVVCFASIGPGEVCANGMKLVGLAQRRTRDGALFHTCSPLDPAGSELARLLDLGDERRRELDSLLVRRSTCLSEAIASRAGVTAPGSEPDFLDSVAKLVVSSVESST